MYLDAATSPGQLRSAFEHDDPELEDDVRRQIRKAVDLAWQHPDSEWDLLTADEMIDRVKDRFDGDLVNLVDEFAIRDPDVKQILQTVPLEKIRESLRLELKVAAERLERWVQGRTSVPPGTSSYLFEFGGGRGPGIEVGPIYQSLRVYLNEPPLSWVPHERVLEILKEEGPYGTQWEEIDDGVYESGWQESADQLRLEIKYRNVDEWAQDMRQEYYSSLVDAEPAKATAALLRELDVHYPALAKRIRKAKLHKDVLADLAVAYFQDPEEGVEILSETTGAFGYEGSRAPTILELDEDVLRHLGVRGDRWKHGAPWRLVNLPPEELAYEGTLMRHCVGRHGMGYKEAVRRGDAAIWSLRSKFNRPVLTFEVDAPEWDAADRYPDPRHARMQRGGAIAQVKGKLNRPPGKDRDERAILEWIFEQLGVDPSSVRDYTSARAANPTSSFCGPWRPYRQRDLPEPRRENPRFAALKQRLLRRAR